MKRSTLIAALMAVMICSLVGNFHFDTVNGDTSVTGIISSDTTWTKINSPYNLTGDIFVDEEATLTIEPGVTVYFNSYFMNVGGTLIARGNETEKIIMTGLSITYSGEWKGRVAFLSTSNNSIIEYAEITSTPGIIIGIYDTSPTIRNCTIGNTTINGGGTFYAITINGGSPIISGNTISYSQGIAISGTAHRDPTVITGNIISHNDRGISISYDASSPVISNNVISDNIFGIILDSMWSNATIANNLIINNYGHLENGYPAPFITEGGGILLISGLSYSMDIRNNTISQNKYGIDIYGSPLSNITLNNIFGNVDYDVHNTLSNDINASNNWWGTTNATSISQSIYDFYDDFNIGKVDFNPILIESNSEAPIIPGTYSILIMPLFMIVTFVGVLFYKKKHRIK